jgi:glycosyltransferase involved in cell wall biosynthesis
MPQLPTVTIAIPTYNRLAYLRQAIQSALGQSYPELEVIVSDNCSDDGTVEAVASIRDQRLVFLKQKKNLGMVGNWNACLERATGEFFLLLSDDDYLEEFAIEKLVQPMITGAEPDRVGVSYCRTWEVYPDGRQRSIDPIPPACEPAREFAMQYFLRNRKIHPCSTMLRTADLKYIGGYTQGSVLLLVDAMAWSRILLLRGVIAGVADPLVSYRIHPGRTLISGRMEVLQNDIRVLAEVWAGAFKDSPANVRRRFHHAARGYESWEMAATINESAGSWRGGMRAMGTYWSCRKSFAGAAGKINCLGGIVKLLAPEVLKRPVRALLLSRQKPGLGQDVA